MSESHDELALDQIKDITSQLQAPISDLSVLLPLLVAPLEAIGLLPPAFRHYLGDNITPSFKRNFQISKHLPAIQAAIIEQIAPAWRSVLQEKNLDHLLFQFLSPDPDTSSLSFQNSYEVVLCSYTTLLSCPLQDFSIEALQRLTKQYSIDCIYSAIYSKFSCIVPHKRPVIWEDVVRSIFSIPAKVANFTKDTSITEGLDFYSFFSHICIKIEFLVSSLSCNSDTGKEKHIQPLVFLITKLINIGLFTNSQGLGTSQASFFDIILKRVRNHRQDHPCFELWREIFTSLPTSLLSKSLTSLFVHLSDPKDDLDTSKETRGLIKGEAKLVSNIIGLLEEEHDEKWSAVASSLLTRTWKISRARVLVCWVSISDQNSPSTQAFQTLTKYIMNIWSSNEHIKHSLLSQHQYLTALLLLTLTSAPSHSNITQMLAFSSEFIEAIGQYLIHLDPAVRRCGMLAAEVVARLTGKELDFQQWAGEGQGREWAFSVRCLIEKRDIDADATINHASQPESPELSSKAEGNFSKQDQASGKRHGITQIHMNETAYDSDDSLEGYASSDSLTRPSSPTPSELEEYEKDPTINITQKKIHPPVYLLDLATMINGKTKPDDPQNADRIRVALECAEELIRKKKLFGFELEENAVNLVYALVGLQDNYELEGFDEKRQNALIALVSCCPRKAAPAIIDEFFKNQYSTNQRFVMLNSLALGARELASLPVHSRTLSQSQYTFPSKKLPAPLHDRYISSESRSQVRSLVDQISSAAIESGKNTAENKVAPLVRERQLRLKQPTRISEVQNIPYAPKESTFSEVAAEYFLGPLIGKFWLFLRDEQTRETRSAYRSTVYHGTGTGLILNPMVLEHFLGTVAVLVHAARNSPAFLFVIAPDALELAITLGTRPMSTSTEDQDREAAVLSAAFELAVVVLDTCLDLDGGRSLCLEHGILLLSAGEWAEKILNALESGIRVQGGGGVQEVKLRRSAAGVVLKVDELSSKWRQSMISL